MDYKKLFDLTGKKAIVTGGGSGLGRSLCLGYAGMGAYVAILDVNLEGATAVAEEMKGLGGIAYPIKCNLLDREDLVKGFDAAVEALGGLDILVNCAGLQYRCDVEDFPMEQWDKIIGVNLTAAFQLSQVAGKKVFLPQKKGKIINIASMNTFVARERIPAYVASKGGIGQLTKAFANEWGNRGVNVNAIAPGYMATKMTAAIRADATLNEKVVSRIPLERWGEPEDLIGALAFLSSAASDYITGVVLPVDGGYLCR